MMQTFAQQLLAMRKEKGLTQEKLAQSMNVSRTTISRWESGHVLPDIETIKRLSQVLNYNFFMVEGMGEETESVSEEQNEACVESSMPQSETLPPPAVVPSQRRRIQLIAAAGVVVLLIMLGIFLLPGLLKKPKAQIVVTASTDVAYLVENYEKGNPWLGWDVTFYYENVSDVPFTPKQINVSFWDRNDVSNSFYIPYEEFRHAMGNDKLIKGNDPLRYPIGCNWLHYTKLQCTMEGVDDNGYEIVAGTTVQLVNTYPPSENE